MNLRSIQISTLHHSLMLVMAGIVVAPNAAFSQNLGRCVGDYAGDFEGDLIADGSGSLIELPTGFFFAVGFSNVSRGAENDNGTTINSGGSSFSINSDGTLIPRFPGGIVILAGQFFPDECLAVGTYSLFNPRRSGTWSVSLTGPSDEQDPDNDEEDQEEEALCEFPLNSPWLNAGGGDFFDPENWAIETVPSSPFAVLFDDGVVDGGIISMTEDHTSEALFVEDDLVEFEFGTTYTLTEDSGCVSSVEIETLEGPDPDVPNSQLTVRGGTINAQSVLVGGSAGTAGKLSLCRSEFNSATTCEIGGDGRGILAVDDTALFHGNDVQLARNVFANGFASVTGADSKMQIDERLIVGGLGNATLQVVDNGEIALADGVEVVIGQGSGSNGSVTNQGSTFAGSASVTLGEQSGSSGSLEASGVSGEGGAVIVDAVVVGKAGQGELILTASGGIDCSQLTVAADERSEGLVRVVGTAPDDTLTGITVDQFTVIAESGTATLIIRDGGGVNSGAGSGDQVASTIAANLGSRGTAIVEGNGSRWDTKILNVGFGGTGELFIRDQATVVSEEAVVGNLEGAIGDVEITGEGIWTVDGLLKVGVEGIGRVQLGVASLLFVDDLTVGRLGVLSVTDILVGSDAIGPSKDRVQSQTQEARGVFTNKLTIEAGGELDADTVTLDEGGELAGDGALDADVTSKGILSPGRSECDTGVLTVMADYTQDAGATLRIKLGGLSAGTEHDVLKVDGRAQLAGTLQVDAIEGFRPDPGQTFAILRSAVVDGQFDAITGDGEYEASYDPDGVVITVLRSPLQVAAPCPREDDPNEQGVHGARLCGAGILSMIPVLMLGLIGARVRRIGRTLLVVPTYNATSSIPVTQSQRFVASSHHELEVSIKPNLRIGGAYDDLE
jgi:T5SS/PEP-CTERM-associated repeat protein